jgi:hypothetical protein
VALALAAVGCGGAPEGDDIRAAAFRQAGLTADVPNALRAACRRIESDAGPTVYCPPVVPAGPFQVRSVDSGRGGYNLDLYSPAIHRSSGGHWATGVTRPGELAWILHPSTSRLAPEVVRRTVRLGAVRAVRYVIPQDVNGGSIYMGHVLYVWKARGRTYYLTLHGRRNGARARLMAEALAAKIARGGSGG